MTRFYIYIVLFCLSIAYASAQLNKKTQKDFNSLQVFSEKGDYKAGLFYTKKTEKSITKKTGSNSIESLLLLCYKAHFSNQVTNKQDSTFLPEIDKRLTEVSNDSNVSALFEVYKQYSTLYYTNGIYSKSDALYKLLNSKREQLLPFERAGAVFRAG